MHLLKNITTLLRVKPLDLSEISNNDVLTVSPSRRRSSAKFDSEHSFVFDRIFNQFVTQAEIFRAIEHSVSSILKGYYHAITTLGPPRSGKTHTLYGTGGDSGAVPRLFQHLFHQIESNHGTDHAVSISMVSVTHDSLTNLLPHADAAHNAVPLELTVGLDPLTRRPCVLYHSRGPSSSGGSSSEASSEHSHSSAAEGEVLDAESEETLPTFKPLRLSVRTTSEALALVNKGLVRHHQNPTSDSHVILQIFVETRVSAEKVYIGELLIVDMAGSLEEDQDNALGILEAVSTHIQDIPRKALQPAPPSSSSSAGSLSAASAKQQDKGSASAFSTLEIEFGESVLTFLLQLSLGGGNCQTTLFPHFDVANTLTPSLLRLLSIVSRAKCIASLLTPAIDRNGFSHLSQLQTDLKTLRRRLREREAEYQKLEELHRSGILESEELKERMAILRVRNHEEQQDMEKTRSELVSKHEVVLAKERYRYTELQRRLDSHRRETHSLRIQLVVGEGVSEELRTHIDELKASLADLLTENETLTAERDALLDSNREHEAESQTRAHDHEAVVSALENELVYQTSHAAKLTNQLRTYEKQMIEDDEARTKQIRALQLECAQLEEMFRQQQQAMLSEKSAHACAVSARQGVIEQLHENLAQLKARVKEEAKLAALNAAKEGVLAKRLRMAEEQLAGQSAELSGLSEELSQVSHEGEEMQRRKAEEREFLRGLLEDIRLQTQEKDSAIENLKADVDMLNDTLAALRKENGELHDSLQKEKRELVTVAQELEVLREQSSSFEKNLDRESAERVRMARMHSEQERALANAEGEAKKWESSYEDLEERMEILHAQFEMLSDEKRVLEKMNSEMSSRIREYSRINEQYSKDVDVFKRNEAVRQGELAHLQDEIETVTAAHHDAVRKHALEMEQLQETLSTVQAELEDEKGQTARLREEKKQMADRRESEAQRLVELERKLARREAEIEALRERKVELQTLIKTVESQKEELGKQATQQMKSEMENILCRLETESRAKETTQLEKEGELERKLSAVHEKELLLQKKENEQWARIKEMEQEVKTKETELKQKYKEKEFDLREKEKELKEAHRELKRELKEQLREREMEFKDKERALREREREVKAVEKSLEVQERALRLQQQMYPLAPPPSLHSQPEFTHGGGEETCVVGGRVARKAPKKDSKKRTTKQTKSDQDQEQDHDQDQDHYQGFPSPVAPQPRAGTPTGKPTILPHSCSPSTSTRSAQAQQGQQSPRGHSHTSRKIRLDERLAVAARKVVQERLEKHQKQRPAATSTPAEEDDIPPPTLAGKEVEKEKAQSESKQNQSKVPPPSSTAMHRKCCCDACDMTPIVGTRYHCNICEDYDLCELCHASGVHYSSHTFTSIPYPSDDELSLQQAEALSHKAVEAPNLDTSYHNSASDSREEEEEEEEEEKSRKKTGSNKTNSGPKGKGRNDEKTKKRGRSVGSNNNTKKGGKKRVVSLESDDKGEIEPSKRRKADQARGGEDSRPTPAAKMGKSGGAENSENQRESIGASGVGRREGNYAPLTPVAESPYLKRSAARTLSDGMSWGAPLPTVGGQSKPPSEPNAPTTSASQPKKRKLYRGLSALASTNPRLPPFKK